MMQVRGSTVIVDMISDSCNCDSMCTDQYGSMQYLGQFTSLKCKFPSLSSCFSAETEITVSLEH